MLVSFHLERDGDHAGFLDVFGWRCNRSAHAGDATDMAEGYQDNNLECVAWFHAGKSIAHGGCWPAAFKQTSRPSG